MRPGSPAGRHPLLAGALFTLLLVLLCALASTPPAGAAVCSRGNVPGATLLVPYFEVDLDTPGGRTTLVSIGSASAEPALVKVTLWTDWGIPVFGFYVALGPEAVQTLNLRDVVGSLQVPPFAGDAERYPGCFAPTPPVAPITAEELQRRLTGQPDGANGCYSRPRADVDLAVGFLTVDLVRDCLPAADSTNGSYLDDEYRGLLLSSNVLWGDVLYVSNDDNAAQGTNAVALRADPLAAPTTPRFFPGLDRLATDETWRSRFLSGGPLDTDTEVVVWIGAWPGLLFPERVECGNDPAHDLVVSLRHGGEAGPLPPFASTPWVEIHAVTRKLAIGELLGDGLPIGGSFELEALEACVACPIIPPPPVRLPSVVWPVHRAAGRFSVGLEATPVGGSCPDPAQAVAR